jgi:hypothetical protein
MIEHYAAVKARLEAATIFTGRVWDSARLDANAELVRDTYLILFGGAPDKLGDGRNTAPQQADSKATYIYTVRAVGTSPTAVRGFLNGAINQLVRFTPVVAGRKCEPMRLDPAGSSGEVKPDNNVNPPMFFADLDFILTSSRA